MELNEEERFENEWRQAFDGAEQPPDEATWEKIERQLPADRRIRPLWLFAAAAVLGLTLLAGGLGWWAGRESQFPATPSAEVISTAPSVTQRRTESATGSASKSATPPRVSSKGNADQAVAVKDKLVPATATKPIAGPVASPQLESPDQRVASAERTIKNSVVQSHSLPANDLTFSRKSTVKNRPQSALERENGLTIAAAEQESNPANGTYSPTAPFPVEAEVAQATAFVADFLNSKTTRPLRVSLRIRPPRVPTATPAIVLPPPVVTPRPPRFWASVGVSPVSYNPQSSLSGRVAAAAVASNTNYQNLNSANRAYDARAANQAALSYRVAGRMGLRLSTHWMLESGLEYLAGQSSIKNDLVLLNRATSEATSLYAGALNQTADKSAGLAALNDLTTQNVFVPRESQLRSTFRYVSVPVQAGYRLWPDKRVEGVLFAGLAGDFFLGNTLKSVNDPSLATVNYSPSDGVYKALVWMGTGGAGLRYRLSPNWGASLNGTYRHAITAGVRSGLGVQTSPREVGVGLRLDYRF
ncbi:MAG: PorT family protein [Cytophagaceae bacterium]|nr:PorT family protein [Cytophagaceae bacterium]